MTIVFLDTETLGLNPLAHGVWEAAWAEEEGEIFSTLLGHHPLSSQIEALNIGHYKERFVDFDAEASAVAEAELHDNLKGATVVGANPGFDMLRLSLRWGLSEPWHYRPIDIETYAMPALGYDKPCGLNRLSADLRKLGYEIPEPDHTAAGDVAAVRECFFALRSEYRERL